MRIAIITPSYLPALRGNAITVGRIASGLAERGAPVEVYVLDREQPDEICARLSEWRPDVVHGFHARAAGGLALTAARDLGVPAVITLTGTDINEDLFDPGERSAVLSTLRSADALVVFHATVQAKLLSDVPDLAGRIHVIGQSVRRSSHRFDLRSHLGMDSSHCVFLQPAGIRRVKNIPAVIPPLKALQRRYAEVRYVVAGPVIEPDEASRIAAMLRGCAWAQFLGPIPHDRLCAGLPSMDVVLSTSLSEGGMPNAVLEAMAQGVAVLASDIEGHRSILTDGVNALLFGSESEFIEKAERLICDHEFRRVLGRNAEQSVEAACRPAEEIDRYWSLYEQIMGAERS